MVLTKRCAASGDENVYRVTLCTWSIAFRCSQRAISFPESSFPLTSGRKTRALGATISDMCNRYKLCSETGWAEFPYFLCYFKMVALKVLVFRPLVKGKEDSGNEIGQRGQDVARCHVKQHLAVLALEKRFKSISHFSVEHCYG